MGVRFICMNICINVQTYTTACQLVSHHYNHQATQSLVSITLNDSNMTYKWLHVATSSLAPMTARIASMSSLHVNMVYKWACIMQWCQCAGALLQYVHAWGPGWVYSGAQLCQLHTVSWSVLAVNIEWWCCLRINVYMYITLSSDCMYRSGYVAR